MEFPIPFRLVEVFFAMFYLDSFSKKLKTQLVFSEWPKNNSTIYPEDFWFFPKQKPNLKMKAALVIHPRKLTWHWKRTMFNRRYIFQWLLFHCHVSFPGCIYVCQPFWRFDLPTWTLAPVEIQRSIHRSKSLAKCKHRKKNGGRVDGCGVFLIFGIYEKCPTCWHWSCNTVDGWNPAITSWGEGSWNPILYKVSGASQVVGNGISEPSTVVTLMMLYYGSWKNP